LGEPVQVILGKKGLQFLGRKVDFFSLGWFGGKLFCVFTNILQLIPMNTEKNWFLYFYVSDTHWKKNVCLLFMAMFESVWKEVELL
jgi:hypothetical protein